MYLTLNHLSSVTVELLVSLRSVHKLWNHMAIKESNMKKDNILKYLKCFLKYLKMRFQATSDFSNFHRHLLNRYTIVAIWYCRLHMENVFIKHLLRSRASHSYFAKHAATKLTIESWSIFLDKVVWSKRLQFPHVFYFCSHFYAVNTPEHT